jgi:hypothetical protein
MRKRQYLGAMLLPVLLGIAAPLSPQSSSPGKAKAATAQATKPGGTKLMASKTPGLPQATAQLNGKVTALDTMAKTVTVKSKSGADVTFTWGDKATAVKPSGTASANVPNAVKVGDSVKVQYTTLGDTKTATKIFIGPAPTEDSGGGHPKGTCLCSDGTTYSKKCCPGGG